jgi:hypothetical protein
LNNVEERLVSPSGCGSKNAAYEIISGVSTDCLPWEKGYTKKTNHIGREILTNDCEPNNTPYLSCAGLCDPVEKQ